MKTIASAQAPIACILEAGEFEERLEWIAALNRAALLTAQREGPRLALTYRPDHADRVRELVRREQQCCGFLVLALREEQGGLTLVIDAPAGLLDAIFEPFLPTSPAREGLACTTGPSRTGGDNDVY